MNLSDIIIKPINMTYKERIIRLIQLCVKEEQGHFGLNEDEILEKASIQALRMSNGEIEKVLKNRMEENYTKEAPK